MVPLFILLVFFFILVTFLRPTVEPAGPATAGDRKSELNDGSEFMAPVLMDNLTSTIVQGNPGGDDSFSHHAHAAAGGHHHGGFDSGGHHSAVSDAGGFDNGGGSDSGGQD